MTPLLFEELRNLIRDKRVLDIGDEGSPFLAELLAAEAKTWRAVGRYPPGLKGSLSENCTVTNAPFGSQNLHLEAEEIDVILFSCPTPELEQDAQCLEWTTSAQSILFLTDPDEDTLFGSPRFWSLLKEIPIEAEHRDASCHLVIYRKPAPIVEEKKVEEHHKRLPKRGERYKLAPNFRWPNKQHGEKAPTIEISSDWKHGAGPATLIRDGQMLHLHTGDLGSSL